MADTEAPIPVSDLTLIATLMTLHHIPLTIDRSSPKRVQFMFPSNVQPVIDAYWNRQCLVEPQEFANQIRVTRARIFEGGAV